MFFSKVVLFTISLGAFSVLATPHALHHHALHRRAVAARAVAARVASMPSFISNSSDVTVRRQNSAKCIDRSHNPSSSSSPSIPAVTPIAPNGPSISIPPIQNPTPVTPTPSPTTTPHQQPPPPATTPTTTPPSTTPPSSNNGPFLGGDGTFFETGLGACGKTNSDSDFIVAISMIRFDAVATGNSNTNPLCNKQVSISYGGKSTTAIIVDRCTGCAENSLDFTPALFKFFADPNVGRIHDIIWSIID